MPSNQEFLSTLFGEDAQWAHVTDFVYDPGKIPADRHLAAWKGDYFSRYSFKPVSNQYFTISTFYADEKGVARRRKALYRATHVIVLDDVREKLSIDQVSKLPTPSWILETSKGSEQWGYILEQPCTDRHRVDNLLDGLVANGLAPDGRDPGMKGVTRYVRLPDGYNTKASRLINGQPFKCQMLSWQPFHRTTLEALAAPFVVDLNAPRREQRIDGAAAVQDHPLLTIPDLVHIKEERSDGRFDITCPWVDEHTGEEDTGTAIFTNSDGTIGFKCHHGACQSRTGRDLLQFINTEAPGFTATLKGWQTQRSFDALGIPAVTPQATVPVVQQTTVPQSPPQLVVVNDPLDVHMQGLKSMSPFSREAREIACTILKVVDDMEAVDKLHWHNEIRDTMRWTKPELKQILQDLREQWYASKSATLNFFDETIFVRELNQFFDRKKRIFYSPESYQNSYAHLDPEARKQALQGGMVAKVDRLDYAPLKPAVFTDNTGTIFGNSWSDSGCDGTPGDVSRYLDHFKLLGWEQNRDHILQWMAYTILYPDRKINHMLLLGSGEGCGKDWLLYPLVKAMGENHMTIDGEELLSGFQDYALSTKHLHINEAELGDRKEAMAVSNKIKPLAAAPPDKLRVNQKGIKPIRISNILSVTMTTNSQMPLRLNGTSRRIYAVWSDVTIRDMNDEITPDWREYWRDRWAWMKAGGAEAVIHYLKHNVDLSKFDPGMAPPMTDFLRNIREASKSPMQQTVEAFILRKVGAFKCDLATAADLTETIKAGPMLAPDICYVDSKMFTPVKMTSIMRDIAGTAHIRMRSKYVDNQVWVLRNLTTYQSMTPVQVCAEYERQQTEMKKGVALTVVR